LQQAPMRLVLLMMLLPGDHALGSAAAWYQLIAN